MDSHSSVVYALKSPGEIKNELWLSPYLAILLLFISSIFLICWTFVGIPFPGSLAATTILDILVGFVVVTLVYGLATFGLVYFNDKMLNDGLPADRAASWAIILSNMTFVGANTSTVIITWISWFLLLIFLFSTPAYYKVFLLQTQVTSSSPQTIHVALNGVGGCNSLYCSITSQAIMYNQTADPSTLRYQACEADFGKCITPFLPNFAGFAEPQSVNSNPGFGKFEMIQIPGVFCKVECSISSVDKSQFPVRSENWQGQMGQIMVNVGINNSTSTTASHRLQVYVGRASLVWYINCAVEFSISQADFEWKVAELGTILTSYGNVKIGPNPLLTTLPPTFSNFDNNLIVPLQNSLGIQYSARIQYLSSDLVLNAVRAYAQSYAAMTTIRSAYMDGNGTASSTFNQGIQHPLKFTLSSSSFFLSPVVGIILLCFIGFLILVIGYTIVMMDKPVFTGSAVQVMSLASGMYASLNGGSSPSWMESRQVDRPLVKIRVCRSEFGVDGETWHLEMAPSTSQDHVDLSRDEIRFLYRYKID